MKDLAKNKRYVLAICIAILLASCTSALPAAVVPPVTSICVVMDNNYPPYIFLDEQGNAQGILVDQWSLWEKHTGVKVELSALPWEEALDGMKNGESDVMDTIFHNNISGIADAEDLKGFRVAIKSGDAEFLIDSGLTSLVYYNSYEEIVKAAERNEVTIFVVDQPPGLYSLCKYGLQDQFNYSAPLFSGDFHRAVKKGDTALLDLVTSGFASINKSEYQAINNRWLGAQQNNRWRQYWPYLFPITLAGLVIIFALVLFARTLQKRVNERTRELNQVLADLQKSERKYREIFNATTEAIFIHAMPDGRLLHVNEPMLRMYGYESEEEVVSMGLDELRARESPYSTVDVIKKIQLAMEEGPQVFEWLARKKNGETFWAESSLRSSQIGGEGQILAVVRDITKRKRAEEALRESEARYRRLADHAPDIIFRYDFYPDMRLTYISPAVQAVTGYTPEECYADSLLMLNMIHRDDMNLMAGYVQTLTPPDEPLFAQWIGKDGITRWMESRIVSIHDADGQIVAVEGIARDITESKRIEEALRESESLLREAQVVADMGSYVLDIASGMWKSSSILDKLFGIDDAYVRSVEGWSNLIHPDHRQQMTNYFANEVVGRRTRFDREYKIIRQNDRAERWVHGLGNLEVDAQDRLVKMHGVIQDITERKQVEQSLREHERQYRTLVEQIPAIVYIDSVGDGIHPAYVSPQVETILGFAPEEWLRKAPDIWDILVHPDDRERVNEEYLRCVQTGDLFETEYRIRTANGRLLWFHDQAIMLRDENGKPQLMHGMMTNITGRKQAENETQQRVMELETLYESGLAINQLLDPTEIGQKVIELLEQKLGWHHTTVRLYHPQDESLELLAFNQPGLKNETERREVEERFKTLVASTTQGMSGWAVHNGQVINSNDLPNDPHYVETYPGLQSGLYVPIKLGNRVIGVISIESEQFNAFSSADERLVATLANQAASALENARLFEAERRQRQVSDALRDALNAGASMSASLDFETILDRLLEALERVVPFEGGSIMIVQGEKQKSSMARMRGYKKLDPEAVEKISKHSFEIAAVENLRRMFNVKRPLIISDVKQYPGWIHHPEMDFIRSWAGAPIIVNDEIIAYFSLDSSELNFFTNDHVEVMRAFTGQASLALQNARLFEETERRFKEFAALYEISNALSADNDLNTLLKDIVEHAATLLDTPTGAMYLRNRTNDDLEIVVTTTPLIPIGTTLKLGEGVAGWVAQTHQPMRIVDYSTWEGRSHKYDALFFRAVLEVPILFGGDLIGILNVAEIGNSNRTFTESDERLLSLFAAQAAGVLHSARLREETSRRAREFVALYETSNALALENELDTMLQVIVEQARKLLGASSGGMYLYLSETRELELTVDSTHSTPLGTRLQLNDGAAGRVAKTYQPLRLDDYATWEGRSQIFDGVSIRAVLEVPMLYGGELIGVLTAEEIGDSDRKFTEDDEHLLSLFASQAAGAIHSARLREQTVRRLDQLQALHIIDRAISSSFDLRPILNTVITQTIAQMNVDAVNVLLFHPHLQSLEYVAGQGFRTRAIEKTHMRLGECFAGRAAFERHTIHIPNLLEAETKFTRTALLESEGFKGYYAVPLTAKGELKGVLEVFSRTVLTLNPEWLDFLETLAGQAAITIDQTQLFDNLQRANLELVIAYDATIEGWARAMDLRDKETENHTRRVTELSLSLAKALGVNDSEMLHIRRGALLHDIGKIGVPDNILLKEGKLTEEEWAFMRRHPQFAYEMLEPIKYLRQALDIPYCHHEKWDGTGYPRGLKGGQIPLVARIFAIVDVWDAIISDRPYRKAWTEQEALAYIREQREKQFDPRVVEAFLKMIGR